MECKACYKEEYRKQNPNVKICGNSIAHTCNQPERLSEKTLYNSDEESRLEDIHFPR